MLYTLKQNNPVGHYRFKEFFPKLNGILVRGQWTTWSSWSQCATYPINPSAKFSERTRECKCTNCTIYCRTVLLSFRIIINDLIS